MHTQILRNWPRGRKELAIRAVMLAQNNGKRNLLSQNWSIVMPKRIGDTIATIFLICMCKRWDALNWFSWSPKMRFLSELPHDKTNKMGCAPSEGSDQPRHPPSLIRVFAVHMKKDWVLSYPLSAQRRLGGCPGWSESLLGAESFCWFCREVAQIVFRTWRMRYVGLIQKCQCWGNLSKKVNFSSKNILLLT